MSLNLPAHVENVLKEAVKYAGVALVVLGAVPAVAQALGLVHIVVPSALLGYATLATGVVGGFLAWAKARGITPASVVASVAHKVR